MTIDDIILYIGIASGLGIIGLIVPSFVRKLLTGNVAGQAKSLIRQ